MANPRVIFRDKSGKFMRGEDRYKPEVAMVQVVRRGAYITVAERGLPPEGLADLLNQREFESLPEALIQKGFYKSGKKYKAWDIAEQIDKTKGIRRKQMKYTVVVQDGTQRKSFSFYHHIKRNSQSSYALFRRINQELGLEGYFLYNKTPGGKLMADRTGKQVKLLGINAEEII